MNARRAAAAKQASFLRATLAALAVGLLTLQSARLAVANDKIRIAYPEATGAALVLLAVAEQQRLFEKHGITIQSIPSRGATVPRVTNEIPWLPAISCG
jgi:ABC-type nitrate/sulfonate/bicarbonate transport system substrate-binding protein